MAKTKIYKVTGQLKEPDDFLVYCDSPNRTNEIATTVLHITDTTELWNSDPQLVDAVVSGKKTVREVITEYIRTNCPLLNVNTGETNCKIPLNGIIDMEIEEIVVDQPVERKTKKQLLEEIELLKSKIEASE